MVYVPVGEFLMGSEGDPDADDDEYPQHTVYLDAFWIDRTEVTNVQFAAFLNQQGNQPEGGVTWLDLEDEECLIERVGDGFRPKSGYADHPVIEVSWYGASAYCQWAGKRLPTEAEWEKAARGTDGRIYPWGNEFDCHRANLDDETELDDYVVPGGEGCDGFPGTAPVGSFRDGASSYGALDMAGNVWEWVADWYDADFYSRSPDRNPTGPSSGDHRVLRGGSWSNPRPRARCADRYGRNPGPRYGRNGFRCCVGPTPSSPASTAIALRSATTMPTGTPRPTEIPEPSPTLTCSPVDGTFAVVWSWVQEAVGCAESEALTGLIVEENFEGGKMFWRELVDYAQILALFTDGTWQIVKHSPYPEGSPEFSCPDASTPSQCPPTPKRGFGMVWCDIPEVRSRLGNATDCERGYQGSMQQFARGSMLQIDSGAIYIFYDDGHWERR